MLDFGCFSFLTYLVQVLKYLLALILLQISIDVSSFAEHKLFFKNISVFVYVMKVDGVRFHFMD